MYNNYETVFILTPVLSEQQMKDAVDKFVNLLKNLNATIISYYKSRFVNRKTGVCTRETVTQQCSYHSYFFPY